MVRVGVVIEASGDRAEVSTFRVGPCGGCSEHAVCAVSVGPGDGTREIVTVDNVVGAKVGDTVEIDLRDHVELELSLLVWAVPVVGLIGGAVLGAALHVPLGVGEDAASLVGALAGFFGSYVLLRRVDRRAADNPKLIPRVTRVVREGGCPTQPGTTSVIS